MTIAWAWERLERSNVGSQAALIELVDPQAGESVLDVGTGSGGLALLIAQKGARVTGIDTAADGIDRASARAAHEGLDVRFDVGDAQSLPYADGEFDVVVSSFGVMWAGDHRRAADELARVVRPGGRLGLTLMPMESRAAESISILRQFGGMPGDHPAAFSDRLDELLGAEFELESRLFEAPPEPWAQTWGAALEESPPLRALSENLAADRLPELRSRVEALLTRWSDRPTSFVMALGRRR
jgi:SAM-dependent methyltransferase